MNIFQVLSSILIPSVHAASGGEHGFPAMPLIFAAINFFILFILLTYLLRKPVKEFFASRSELIKKDIEDSQELKATAQSKHQEFDSRLKNIEQEMKNLVTQLKKDGELEREHTIKSAHQQSEELKKTSERIINQELRKAKEALKEQTVELAAQLTEDLVKKNLSSEDQRRLLRESVSQIGRGS